MLSSVILESFPFLLEMPFNISHTSFTIDISHSLATSLFTVTLPRAFKRNNTISRSEHPFRDFSNQRAVSSGPTTSNWFIDSFPNQPLPPNQDFPFFGSSLSRIGDLARSTVSYFNIEPNMKKSFFFEDDGRVSTQPLLYVRNFYAGFRKKEPSNRTTSEFSFHDPIAFVTPPPLELSSFSAIHPHCLSDCDEHQLSLLTHNLEQHTECLKLNPNRPQQTSRTTLWAFYLHSITFLLNQGDRPPQRTPHLSRLLSALIALTNTLLAVVPFHFSAALLLHILFHSFHSSTDPEKREEFKVFLPDSSHDYPNPLFAILDELFGEWKNPFNQQISFLSSFNHIFTELLANPTQVLSLLLPSYFVLPPLSSIILSSFSVFLLPIPPHSPSPDTPILLISSFISALFELLLLLSRHDGTDTSDAMTLVASFVHLSVLRSPELVAVLFGGDKVPFDTSLIPFVLQCIPSLHIASHHLLSFLRLHPNSADQAGEEAGEWMLSHPDHVVFGVSFLASLSKQYPNESFKKLCNVVCSALLKLNDDPRAQTLRAALEHPLLVIFSVFPALSLAFGPQQTTSDSSSQDCDEGISTPTIEDQQVPTLTNEDEDNSS
ncbi:hypothetical protein BLNAU_556 [Blattamonas nauphoetae]|uniref:Uncharacterized protein n=1 Tax=Blattamonas nauphoetae TaxID=2049346 RepID=A0ABQ9YM64_9EUKA|nr:hypothetical protein BLNAU_556 [Blattamonas nauphoetae]